MTSHEWTHQWARLGNQFKASVGADLDALSAEWFAQLKHYHVDAIDAGITALIGQATDTFWPALGKLKAAIQSRLDKYDQTKAKCETCNGSTWVEAWPWWNDGRVYTGFERCPNCARPAPSYKEPYGRTRLTKEEVERWRLGQLEQRPVPLQKGDADVLQALQSLRRLPSKAQRFVRPDELESPKDVA